MFRRLYDHLYVSVSNGLLCPEYLRPRPKLKHDLLTLLYKFVMCVSSIRLLLHRLSYSFDELFPVLYSLLAFLSKLPNIFTDYLCLELS